MSVNYPIYSQRVCPLQITNRTYVCSAHFKDEDFKFTLTGMRKLKPGALPSVFAWTKDKTSRRPPKVRRLGSDSPTSEDSVSGMLISTATHSHSQTHGNFHDYDCAPLTNEEKLEAAQKRIDELEKEVSQYRLERFGLQRFSNDPDMVKFYTGFTSYELLSTFFQAISPHATKMVKWTQFHRHRRQQSKRINRSFNSKLHPFDQLFMFLHKLRLGSLDQDLADKFGVSQSTVSRNTVSWANFLYCILGSQPLWPTRELIKSFMPKTFSDLFPDVRVILDCTELKVQSPSSLLLNSELYSSYKGSTTLKALVGITPAGAVSFVSNLYSGSISDKHITRVSGILSLIEAGDVVMADKGFLIEDLLTEKGCSLLIPHFLSAKGQFSATENSENQTIANLRVHVERAIRRFREFHFFDSVIPLNLAGTINQLWSVCCMLTNFQGPLIKSS